MFMQEFSYTVVHVKGEDNVVADSLLRLYYDYLHNDVSEQALNGMITSLITEGFSAFQGITTATSKEENKEVNRHLRAFVFELASSYDGCSD
jgi:hypothetical protein